MAFTGKYDSDSDSSDEENTEEELAEIVTLFVTRWKEACMVVEKQKKLLVLYFWKKRSFVQPLRIWKKKSHC